MKCPPILDRIIFADDAKLAAQLSCELSRPGFYLPVCDGPRLQRPDRNIELVRRHNAAGRARANVAYLAGLRDASANAMRVSLNTNRSVPCHRISSPNDIAALVQENDKQGTLAWGRDRIGIGLLKALHSGLRLTFEDKPSDYEWVPSENGHIVVCEEGVELSEVIAANYAYSLGAGLFLIPKVDADLTDDLLGRFYNVHNHGDPAEAQTQLRQELLALCGSIPIPDMGQ